jgi:hypothetical protein
MFQRAAEVLAKRGINPPAANASNDEAVKYNAELRSFMLQEQKKEKEGQPTQEGKKRDTMFSDVEDTVDRLRSDLSETCKWLSIDRKAINAGANPVDVLD